MNIEQIAIGIKDTNGLDMSDEAAITLIRRFLSKLAEQVDMEPVACYNPNVDAAEDAFNWYCNTGRSDADYPVALYTETQLLSAQQRTAEACAELCRKKFFERSLAGVTRGASTALYLDTAIRNGDWRKYL